MSRTSSALRLVASKTGVGSGALGAVNETGVRPPAESIHRDRKGFVPLHIDIAAIKRCGLNHLRRKALGNGEIVYDVMHV